MQKVANEGESARLASQRAAAQAQKKLLGTAEMLRLEVAHQGFLLLAAILADDLQTVGAQRFGVAVIRQASRTELFGQRQFGARDQPVRNMIALGVEDQRLHRDRSQRVLHAVQIAGPSNFGAVGEAEDEIAEGKLPREELAHVGQQRLGALAQKGEALGVGARLKLRIARLQHHRNIGNHAAHQMRQREAGGRIEVAIAGKLHVGDHPEQMAAIAVHNRDGALIILRQQDRRFRAFHFIEHRVGKVPVGLLIIQPVLRPKYRARVRDMAKRPDSFVGEALVVTLFFFCRQPYSPQRITWPVRRDAQAIMRIHYLAISAACAMRDPRPVARQQHRLQRGN